MTELRTIYCDVSNCEETFTEEKFNQGFPDWGHIIGLMNEETGETRAHVCPYHLQKIKGILNDGKLD